MIIQFIGGPLDGQQIPSTSGRRSCYRSDDGSWIAATTGDTEWRRPQSGKGLRRRFYAQQRRTIVETINGERQIVTYIDYVHATVWVDYQTRIRRRG